MKSISDSTNTTQAIWVGMGQFSSFTLSIISAAILSRYFNKTDYGTYKQILYIYNTLLVLFSAGLQGSYSYFLPKQTMEEGKDFVIKLIKVFVFLGLCFSVFLFVLAPVLSELFNNPELKKGLRVFSIVPFLMLPTIGFDSIYATIRKAHVIASYTTVTRIMMLALITLPIILLQGTYITALKGWIISSFVICALSIYLILKPFRHISRLPTIFSQKDILKYSLPLMIATVYGILIRFADQFFISRYYGTEVFAEFSNGFIELPFVSMMITATVTVLLPLFSKYNETVYGIKDICQTWKNSTEKSVILVFPILSFFVFNAKSSVIALYGEQYTASAIYFIIGMLTGFFNIITFQVVIFALGKTRLYSRIHLAQAVLIWIAGYLVIFSKGTPIIYAIISRSFYIGQVCIGIFYAIKYLGIRAKDVVPFKTIYKTLFHSSVICSLTSLTVGQIDVNVFLKLGFSGLISIALILSTGSLVGIRYWATIKTMLFNIPGFSYSQNKK